MGWNYRSRLPEARPSSDSTVDALSGAGTERYHDRGDRGPGHSSPAALLSLRSQASHSPCSH